MNHWCESCARKNNCYATNIRPKCFVAITNTAHGTPQNYLVKAMQESRDNQKIADTPQTDCIDKAKADIAERSSWSKTYENMCKPQTDIVFYDYDPNTDDAHHIRWHEPQTDCAWMYDSRRDYDYDKALDEMERNE